MKHAKSQTLMFQLIVFFSVILIAMFLLIAFSWENAQREDQTNEAISAVTTPYTQLYTGLDAVSKSFNNMGRKDWIMENMTEVTADIENASRSLTSWPRIPLSPCWRRSSASAVCTSGRFPAHHRHPAGHDLPIPVQPFRRNLHHRRCKLDDPQGSGRGNGY